MANKKIGDAQNSVTIEYASDADNAVAENLVELLNAVIKPGVAAERALTKIFISATTNGNHAANSGHYTAKAIDISRINEEKISLSYSSDAEVKAIVDAIQDEADKQS
jgi:hypothetical protein